MNASFTKRRSRSALLEGLNVTGLPDRNACPPFQGPRPIAEFSPDPQTRPIAVGLGTDTFGLSKASDTCLNRRRGTKAHVPTGYGARAEVTCQKMSEICHREHPMSNDIRPTSGAGIVGIEMQPHRIACGLRILAQHLAGDRPRRRKFEPLTRCELTHNAPRSSSPCARTTPPRS